jgi:hypothetical protein
MIPRRPFRNLSLFILTVASISVANAQCTNTTQYPGNSVTPEPGGAVTTITTCSYQTEYSRITGIVAGSAYQFTISDGSYITVHQGSNTGPVLGHGFTPVTVVANTSADLYPTWNVNAACSTASICLTTTVRRFLDCQPPSVTYTTENDCANNGFYVNVLVSDTGDASSLNFAYTVNGGNLQLLTGVGLGNNFIGPFPLDAVIDLTVVHGDNANCNVVFNDITNLPCATESCGPDTYTHCYGNSENYVVHYQGTSSYPLRLQFNSGAVSPSGNDALIIYDGLYTTDPILFSGVGNAGNLTGVSVVSTNPDHALTLTMTSNGSFSCGDGGVSPEWNYTVACLDCTVPAGNAGPVVTNCAGQNFTVTVNVTDMGSATSLQIANSVGAPELTVTSAGTYTAGPFPLDAPVGLTLVNLQSTICAAELGTFENEFCSQEVVCDGPLTNGTYCYGDNDAHAWLYENSSMQPLAITFTQGIIENVTWDHLTMYDGADNTAPVLWQHTQSANFNLAGLTVVSTGQQLFMEMTSDGSVSCSAGNFAAWIWSVGCLDCTNPTATYSLIADCIRHRFTVELNVTGLGTASELRLANSLTSDTLENIGLGITTVGPFPMGTAVSLSLLNTDNALCRLNSPPLAIASDSCLIVACDPTATELCYGNGDTLWYSYTSGTNIPISLTFLGGGMLAGDAVQLYNGADTTAQLVYAGNYGGDLGGLSLTSNNTDNALTLLVVGNGAGSCASGEVSPPLYWTVGCGLVGVEPAAGSNLLVFPVPTEGMLTVSWPVNGGKVTGWQLWDALGQVAMEGQFPNGQSGAWQVDLGGLANGTYLLRAWSSRGVHSAPVVVAR